jgi:tetratricopeptide (TPR) repeat protein
VLALQEDISREISQKLRLRLTGDDAQRMVKSHTADPEAYEAYLRGLYWWNKSTPEGLSKGIQYFQQAIEKDPTYALAYAGMAFCYSSRAGFGFVAPTETFPQAKEAALKALEIDDTLAEGHTALGFIQTFYEWDWAGAEKEFQQAIALNPNYALAHLYYGLELAYTGQAEQSVLETKRALGLDPLSLLINRDLGYVWYFARQYDQTIQQEQKTLEIEPNYALAHLDLGNAYVQKSMYKQGIAEFAKMLAIAPDSSCALSGLGYAYAVSGNKSQAQRMLERLKELSNREYVSGACRARIYAGLGSKDEAFRWLEKSYDDRSIGGGTALKVDPIFDSMRADPRFAALLRRMNQSR